MSDPRNDGPDTVPNPRDPRLDPALDDRPGDVEPPAAPAQPAPASASATTPASSAAPSAAPSTLAATLPAAAAGAAPGAAGAQDRRASAAPAPRASSGASSSGPPWERKLLEDLAFAALRERRSGRRWTLFFRFTWLLLLGVFIYFAFIHRGVAPSTPTGPHTAVVHIRGEISATSEASAEKINRALRSAFEASDARAVVLRINSPGGSPVQSGLVFEEIRRLRAKHDKPVYAVVEEAAASGAYYIAAAADRIYVDPASLVGSIGVLMNGFGFTGLMDKLGIERRLLTAGESKAFMDPFSPQSEADRQHLQRLLDSIHQQFIRAVREGRGDRVKDDASLFTGLVWTGEQAVGNGLADEIGSLGGVARDVVQAERLVDYTLRENVAERLARRFGAGVGEGAVRALQALPDLR